MASEQRTHAAGETERRRLQRSPIVIAFAASAVLIAGFAVYRFFFVKAEAPTVRARTIVPVSAAEQPVHGEASTERDAAAQTTSFITLAPTETMLSTLSFDFDGDMFDDQIVAVRKADSQHIFLIVGLYVPERHTYVRRAEIDTGISRSRTLSYVGLDVVGDHSMTLVYQGIRDDARSIMRFYRWTQHAGTATLSLIGDFESDGALFIQRADRSTSYELLRDTGESYAVWVYSSEPTDAGASSAQIQTQYNWNARTERYEQTQQVRIGGSALVQRERARIQDGTVETFAAFLDGLWYKTVDESSSLRHLYFDFAAHEIVFLYADSQEVYRWEESTLHRTGMYLTGTNAAIANLRRRLDVTLVGVDTVRMRIIDDVRTLVREPTLWDGEYRKLSLGADFSSDAVERASVAAFDEALNAGPAWIAQNAYQFTFTDGAYTLSAADEDDSGLYRSFLIGSTPVIQFLSSTGRAFLSHAYRMEFGQSATAARSTTVATPHDVIVLTPVYIQPNGVVDREGIVLSLSRAVPSQ